jgi:hypothetical protein
MVIRKFTPKGFIKKKFPSFSPNLCSSSLEKYVFQPQEKSLWPYISLVSEQIIELQKTAKIFISYIFIARDS